MNSEEKPKARGALSLLYNTLSFARNILVEGALSWTFILAGKRGKNAMNPPPEQREIDKQNGKLSRFFKRYNGRRKYSIRGMFAAAAFAIAGHAYIGTQFQTAEEFLEAEGLDPKIAEELSSDTQIHIRDRNLWGALHSYTDVPTALGLYNSHAIYQARENAYLTKGLFGVNELLFNTAMVTLPYRDISAAQRISAMAGIPEELLENISVSDEELYYFIVFHELAHGQDSNIFRPSPMTEADADERALEVAERLFNNPELRKVVTAIRGMSTIASTHNSGLYLDTINEEGEKPAHWAFSQGSTVTVFGLAQQFIATNDTRPQFIKMTAALKEVLEVYDDELSVWDKRRAQLYIDSAEYFAPSSVKDAVPLWKMKSNIHDLFKPR